MKNCRLSISSKEIPGNPKFRNPQTYMAMVCVEIKPEWYELSREERVKITRKHIEELAPFAKRVARTNLTATGLSKYDSIEILEAEDIKEITGIVRGFKAGAKAAYMEIKDVIVGVKGMSDLVKD